MKDCRTPMSCCDPHCCCDIIHKPTDTVTAVLNGQPIAITGEAATVIKQKNADIADLVAGLKRVRGFIGNGIDLGFIRMPDEGSIDTAHEVPPLVDALITKHSKGENQ